MPAEDLTPDSVSAHNLNLVVPARRISRCYAPQVKQLKTVPFSERLTITNAGDMATAEVVGKRLAQTPKHRATATLTYDNPKIATLAGAVRYVGRQFADTGNTSSLGA